MNTKHAYKGRLNNGASRYMQAPVGMAQVAAVEKTQAAQSLQNISKPKENADVNDNNMAGGNAYEVVSPVACDTLPRRTCRHPLTNLHENAQLARCEEAIKGRFEAIVPMLKKLANLQHEVNFVDQAQKLAQHELDSNLPVRLLNNAWVDGLDMRSLYASCVFSALQNSVAQFSANLKASTDSRDDTKSFFLDCGYHSVDITPCSDGRLKGLSKYILRLPLSAMTVRNAYAGALFNVEANIHHWESVELARLRSAENNANEETHYLKVVVYHRSSSDPLHQGCAAHGSNDQVSAEAGLNRLNEFREAIENTFCCGASIDTLLIGVDTDNDSIRIHVPDSEGNSSIYRYVDNALLYHDTLNVSADQARIAIYDAIEKSIESNSWGKGVGQPREGMRKLLANLLINNLSQIEYVGDLYEGQYPDIGHAEKYISVGDGFREVQLRNLAYYAHLSTVEEGTADLDIGIKIFTGLNLAKGMPIPVAIHYFYDSKVPGLRDRMVEKCRRVKSALLSRYKELAQQKNIICQMSLQDRPLGSALEIIEEESV